MAVLVATVDDAAELLDGVLGLGLEPLVDAVEHIRLLANEATEESCHLSTGGIPDRDPAQQGADGGFTESGR
ncbi:hypothetical protein GCM10022244_13040 [Streptomyces gulbargensis]|uniref:Uncharacterized protein n=1 Tax=Streptomyces gulbargensis TaxID=364901 RepID=A0ABP7LN86_9ACTN